ncbi:MAG: tyrosine-type recombinase/integrase [Thiobacillaceae bacterium]
MGRRAIELSPLEVARLTAPGFYSVGVVPGLALQITSRGTRSWILRIRVAGKRRDMGLGAFPGVTLAGAREKARVMREQVDNGIDPILDRRLKKSALTAELARSITFTQATDGFLKDKAAGWKNAKHAAQWAATLEQYAFPVIGKLQARDVDLPHVLAILRPLWEVKTETASRLRGRIDNILDWATVHGYRAGPNPARWKGHLDKLLPAPSKVSKVEHLAALPYQQINLFLNNLHLMEGIAARAVEFAIITAARSGEVRGATWDEINLQDAVWTIPAERMKAGKEHRIPLSDRALQLLLALPRSEDSEHVFPSPRGKELSDMSLSAVLRRMAAGFTVHGMRSTFRDWAGETTGFPREVIEHALAHQIKDRAEAAYARGSLFEKRRRLMAEWSTYAYTPAAAGATVTPIRGGV